MIIRRSVNGGEPEEIEIEVGLEDEAPTRCGCVQRMNDALRETYPGVRLLVDITGQRPVIAITKLRPRAKSPVIFPTYCPFCGVKCGD